MGNSGTPAPTYQQAALIATTAYQNALAKLNQQRSSLLRQYGYLGDIDPKTGTVKNVRVDPNNPYGSFQTLLHTSALNSEQAYDTAEGRGLHGGLAHQLERDAQYEHGAQSAQLGLGLTGALSDYEQSQEQAKTDEDRALYEAQLDWTRNVAGGMDETGGGSSTDPGTDPGTDPSTTTTTGSTQHTGGGGNLSAAEAAAIAAANADEARRRMTLISRVQAGWGRGTRLQIPT